jgi:formylglycine-generating enzyme required for sulfatase activity
MRITPLVLLLFAMLAQVSLGEPTVNSIGMRLVPIPAGQFQMGSLDSDSDANDNEKPQHLVKITKPFYLSVYEVTQQQYEQVMGANPSHFKGDDGRPVEQVSWFDAIDFCNRLSEREGLPQFYKVEGGQVTVAGGGGYRLPTEVEWEYVCRAGNETAYCFGDEKEQLDQFDWFGESSKETTHPVGQKQANAWGLYDMHGNAFEWCWDWYAEYQTSPSENPTTASRRGNSVCLP